MQTLTLRERRRKALLDKIARLTRKRNEAIKTLVKAENLLPQLERRARLLDRPVKRALPTDSPPPAPAAVPLPTIEPDVGGDGVPDFLRRKVDESKRLGSLPDPRAKEKKAERRAVEKQKLEANLRGQTRKMPLEGRAALAKIKERDET
jgi:hypothetical protein